MISKLYQSFIMECIKYLEENPLYSSKLNRLKELTKVSSSYLDAMTEMLLMLFWENDTYHNVCNIYNDNEEKDILNKIDSYLRHYENMCKTYILDVTIDGYEQIISRTIQVPHDATLGTVGLAVIESIGGQSTEYYMSHGDLELYPAYFDQKLHFTESDPYEEELAKFNFGKEPIEMLYSGLTIRIQLKEIQTTANIYEPQSYVVLGGTGLDLYINEKKEETSVKIVHKESMRNVPYDIHKKVEEGVLLYQLSFVTPHDYEFEDEFDE